MPSLAGADTTTTATSAARAAAGRLRDHQVLLRLPAQVQPGGDGERVDGDEGGLERRDLDADGVRAGGQVDQPVLHGLAHGVKLTTAVPSIQTCTYPPPDRENR